MKGCIGDGQGDSVKYVSGNVTAIGSFVGCYAIVVGYMMGTDFFFVRCSVESFSVVTVFVSNAASRPWRLSLDV